MNQLAYRYATKQMRDIWSEDRRLMTHRQLWIALAEAQMEVGLLDTAGKPRVRPEMIAELKSKLDTFKEDPTEIKRLSELEEDCKHDVVAHVRLLGELCPRAKEIIHLGATSCDITDNADLILVRESLVLLRHRLVGAIDSLAAVAEKNVNIPCVAYTHYQSAQFTTVGKRVCMWLSDLVDDLMELDRLIDGIGFRGLKGATGTQASYLQLFNGDGDKVIQLEDLFARKMGFKNVYLVTGQTYSRKTDSRVMAGLSGVGQTLHKFATDVRLLQHDGEMQEPFGTGQVGSSAMPYKRNPMRSERLCSLARYVVNESHNAEMTAMTQWLERTLDDSAVRRIGLPNAFLATDACLKLALNISSGLQVNYDVIRRRTSRELPFVATENVMMLAVKAGGDRQKVHAIIREESIKAGQQVAMGETNDLLRNLMKRPEIGDAVRTLDSDFRADRYTGLAARQAQDFLTDVIGPLREKYPESVNQHEEVRV